MNLLCTRSQAGPRIDQENENLLPIIDLPDSPREEPGLLLQLLADQQNSVGGGGIQSRSRFPACRSSRSIIPNCCRPLRRDRGNNMRLRWTSIAAPAAKPA